MGRNSFVRGATVFVFGLIFLDSVVKADDSITLPGPGSGHQQFSFPPSDRIRTFDKVFGDSTMPNHGDSTTPFPGESRGNFCKKAPHTDLCVDRGDQDSENSERKKGKQNALPLEAIIKKAVARARKSVKEAIELQREEM